jgi:soluble lytic murein transglycosylase-like protein
MNLKPPTGSRPDRQLLSSGGGADRLGQRISMEMQQPGTPPPGTSDTNQLAWNIATEEQEDPVLVLAMLEQESGGDPGAISSAGARGLMQLMPGTAREMGVTDMHDPQQNIRGGVRYLKQQLKRYNGDIRLALAAYNAGPGAVDQYGGIPPFAETQSYVEKVLERYKRIQNEYAGVR